MAADLITLSIPPAKPFHGVARLVVGGLAARLDVTYEHLEDLQLALATVLERDGYLSGEDVVVRLRVEDGSVAMAIGPLHGDTVRADLERESGDGLSLARLLSQLVDRVRLDEEGGGHWLSVEKRVPMRRPDPRPEA